MMHIHKFARLAVALLVLGGAAAGPATAGGKHDWLIVPGERIGPITPASTEKDLLLLLGVENLKRSEIGVGEGETVKGLRVYPGTPNELEIIWKSGTKNPASVTAYGEGGKWKTRDGLRIGSTLAEVEAANGKAFKLYGFGWDYGGRVAGWNGGKLSEQIYMDFEPTGKVPEKQAALVLGDSEFASDLPIMRKMLPVVRRITVEFK